MASTAASRAELSAGGALMATPFSHDPSGRDVSRELTAKQLEAKRDW